MIAGNLGGSFKLTNERRAEFWNQGVEQRNLSGSAYS